MNCPEHAHPLGRECMPPLRSARNEQGIAMRRAKNKDPVGPARGMPTGSSDRSDGRGSMHSIIRLWRRMAGIGGAPTATCVRRAEPDKRLSQSCTRTARPRYLTLPGCVKRAVSRDGHGRHTAATVCLESQTDKLYEASSRLTK